jgi:hypothetical protein
LLSMIKVLFFTSVIVSCKKINWYMSRNIRTNNNIPEWQ